LLFGRKVRRNQRQDTSDADGRQSGACNAYRTSQ
jgi:hypothetical protein